MRKTRKLAVTMFAVLMAIGMIGGVLTLAAASDGGADSSSGVRVVSVSDLAGTKRISVGVNSPSMDQYEYTPSQSGDVRFDFLAMPGALDYDNRYTLQILLRNNLDNWKGPSVRIDFWRRPSTHLTAPGSLKITAFHCTYGQPNGTELTKGYDSLAELIPISVSAVDSNEGSDLSLTVSIGGASQTYTMPKSAVQNNGTGGSSASGLGNHIGITTSIKYVNTDKEDPVPEPSAASLLMYDAKEKYAMFEDTGDSEIPVQEFDAFPATVRRPEKDPVKLFSDFEGYYSDPGFTRPFDFGTPINCSVPVFLKWKKAVDVNMSATDGGTYSTQESTLTHFNGADKANDGTPISTVSLTSEKIAGADAVVYRMHSWNPKRSQAIVFAQPVDLDAVAGIKIRMYAHLSPSDAYKTDKGGVRIFGLDQTGQKDEGYMLASGVKQDEWFYLTLTEDTLREFADADGMLRGLQMGSFIEAPGSQKHLFYIGENTAYVALQSVGVYEETAFAIADGEGEAVRLHTYTATENSLTLPAPKDKTKVFTGYRDDNGNLVDFTRPIYGETAVTATYADAAETFEQGLYVKGDSRIFLTGDGVLVDNKALVGMLACGVTREGVLVAVSEDNEVTEYDLAGDYQKTEHVTVTYRTGDGRDFVRYIPKGTTADNIAYDERAGYIFRNWSVDEEGFDFSQTVNEDLTLTAVYDYDLLSDVSSYLGTYYSETDGTVVLKADGTAQIGEETCEYFVLTSFEIVFERREGKVSGTLLGGGMDVGDAFYTRLGAGYTVFLDYNGAGENVTETVGAEQNYKLSRPADPSLEGYRFLGWFEAEAEQAFDFDALIARDISLEARFEKLSEEDENSGGTTEENSEGKKKGCKKSAAGGGIAVAVLAGAVWFLRRK